MVLYEHKIEGEREEQFSTRDMWPILPLLYTCVYSAVKSVVRIMLMVILIPKDTILFIKLCCGGVGGEVYRVAYWQRHGPKVESWALTTTVTIVSN